MAKEFTAKNQPIARTAAKRVTLHVWNSVDEVRRWWDSKASKDLREVGARYGKFRVFAIEGLEQQGTRRTGN